jgi:hypothetical protein
MQEKPRKPASLNLEVHEIERHMRPGCTNSTSTSPRCTCPPPAQLRS